MRKLKKILILAMCALMAFTVMSGLTACQFGGGGGYKQPEVSDDDVIDYDVTATIKVAYKAENNEKAIVESLASEFKKTFPNVTVEYIAYNGSTSTAITKMFNAGKKEMPDVFMSDQFSMLTLTKSNGLLLNLTPYIERDVKKNTFNPSDYYDSYMRLGQLDFNGVQYMMPRSADRVVCHINKNLIKKVEAETGDKILEKIHNGWTWEEFYEVCTLLNKGSEFKKSGRYLLDDQMKWEAVWNPIFKSYGVEYFDEAGNVAIDSDETKEALNVFKKWVDDEICASPTSGKSADFEFGRGVFYFNSMAASQERDKIIATNEKDFNKDNVSEYYDVVTVPVKEDKPLIGAGAAGYCGFAGSDNPEVVWQFLKFLVSKDGQNAIADAGVNYVPVRKDMADYTDTENNHWGRGCTDINLAAYVYKSGELLSDGNYNEDWNCNTDYFAVKGSKYAVDLNEAITAFVTSYASGKPYSNVVGTLKTAIKAALRKK